MKKFPLIKDFDFKSEDQTKNFKLIVDLILTLRTDKSMTWRQIEIPYKTSTYNDFISWSKVYSFSSKKLKGMLPTPVKVTKSKLEPSEIVFSKEAKLLTDLILDTSGKNPIAEVIRELLLKDLTSKNSVLLSMIII